MNPLIDFAPAIAAVTAAAAAFVPVAPPAPVAVPVAESAACTTSLTAAEKQQAAADFVRDIENLINADRATAGLSTLTTAPQLSEPATAWTQEMAAKNQYGISETLPGGGVRGQAVRWASNPTTAADFYNEWKNDPQGGLNQYVMSKRFGVIGGGATYTEACTVFVAVNFAGTATSNPTPIPRPVPVPKPTPRPRPVPSFSA